MMAVPDIEDVFLPLESGFLVNPVESRPQIETLLDNLPAMFSSNNISTDACLGAAVKAVQLGLKKSGGKMVIMHTSLPTYGLGALKPREDPKLFGTDAEKQLFAPQSGFYVQLAEQCVDAGIGVDMFLFPAAYIDVASVGALTSVTGGQTHLYSNFNVRRDAYKFAEELRRTVTRSFGYDCLLRVRCGNGLRVVEHFGNFYMKNSTDVGMGVCDSEKAIAVQFKHDGKLPEAGFVSFQVAMLYTSPFGSRFIRVINLELATTTEVGQVFKHSDIDACINFFAKSAIPQTLSIPLKQVRELITDRSAQILTSYRRHCTTSGSPGQLILPESFKLLPIYALCVLKSRPICPQRDLTSDFRVSEMRNVRGMGVQTSVAYFYPRMMRIFPLPTPDSGGHDVSSAPVCEYDPELQRFRLPPSVRCSGAYLDEHAVFLLDTTQLLIMWIGKSVPAQFFQDVFNLSSASQLDLSLRTLPTLSTPLSQRLRALLHEIQEEKRRGAYVQLQIVRQDDGTGMEGWFLGQLVEDKTGDLLDYVDYLCLVHKRVQTALQEDS